MSKSNIEYLYVCYSSYVGESECFLDLKYTDVRSQVFSDYTEMCKYMFRQIRFIKENNMNNIILWINIHSTDNPSRVIYTYFYAYMGKTNIGDRFFLTDRLSTIKLNLPFTDSRNIMQYRLEEISHFIPNKEYEKMYKKARLEVKLEKDMGE